MQLSTNMLISNVTLSFASVNSLFKSKEEHINLLTTNLKESIDNKIYINISQIAKALGVSRETAAVLVFELKYFPNGREKLYLVNDVAEKLYNSMCCDSVKGVSI